MSPVQIKFPPQFKKGACKHNTHVPTTYEVYVI